jgi:hypothetical protein
MKNWFSPIHMIKKSKDLLGRLTAQIAQTDNFGGINWPLSLGILLCIMLSIPLYDFLSNRIIQRITINLSGFN